MLINDSRGDDIIKHAVVFKINLLFNLAKVSYQIDG